MRALVTGATGFLGSSLARRLDRQGHDVTVLVRSTSDRSRLTDVRQDVAYGDITDAESVDRVVSGVDVVFHAAALYEMGPADPTRLDRVNVEGAGHVFEAGSRHEVPVVHVSSVTALGPTGTEQVDETYWNPAEPGSHYERTKRDAHLLARRYQAEGADVRVGSPGGIYGPGDTSTLGQMIERFMKLPVTIGFLPDVVQSTVYVDDCADALIRMAEVGAPSCEYVLCAESVTMREWQDAITEAAGRRRPLAYVPSGVARRGAPIVASAARVLRASPERFAEYTETALRSWAYTGQKARDDLGWNPRPLVVGLAEIARSHGRA